MYVHCLITVLLMKPDGKKQEDEFEIGTEGMLTFTGLIFVFLDIRVSMCSMHVVGGPMHVMRVDWNVA